MRGRLGVLLLDGHEVLLSVYELDGHLIWRQPIKIPFKEPPALKIIETIADLSYQTSSLKINIWKVSSRNLPSKTRLQVSEATGQTIDEITRIQEQELISLGLFYEVISST